MKNVLIPTDFSIRSLGYVHNVVSQYPGEMVNVIFMHALRMPDSIFDLVTFTRNSRHIELISADFKDGCEIIRNKYASAIKQLKVEFFHGDTNIAFKNFCIANDIDVILQPMDLEYKAPGKRSYNPEKIINRSKLPKITAPLPGNRKILVKATISSLLLASE
ncbi:hypothetical protein [Chitinophaga sp. Cy-1792]|uniref:hypothetical protein n=1 Tax=Chitinophaga sp. Cy-1792 TaxID=2608339 RepID=UPI00142455B6|nr:hypothetical protein [Chitinophaga sp. Cy-1792]NIG53397.1 hypothetical protein [Chitinophaga sp. Cy-1792]